MAKNLMEKAMLRESNDDEFTMCEYESDLDNDCFMRF